MEILLPVLDWKTALAPFARIFSTGGQACGIPLRRYPALAAACLPRRL
jgi:hypothetical protein